MRCSKGRQRDEGIQELVLLTIPLRSSLGNDFSSTFYSGEDVNVDKAQY